MKRIAFGYERVLGDWIASRTGGTFVHGEARTIGLLDNGEPIAGVLYDQYNGASIGMHVAAEPGARWMTREFLRVCFAYPFEQLGVRKIIGLVGSGNTRARAFDEHLGFVLEATLKEAHPDGDLLVYSMTRSQCRWLDLNKRHRLHGQQELSTAGT